MSGDDREKRETLMSMVTEGKLGCRPRLTWSCSLFSIRLRKVVYNMVAKEKKKKQDKDWRGDLLYLGKLIFWISGVCFFIFY